MTSRERGIFKPEPLEKLFAPRRHTLATELTLDESLLRQGGGLESAPKLKTTSHIEK